MAAIVVKAYNGLKPISDPLLLDNAEAQIANNVWLISGAMRPLRALTVMRGLAKVLPMTIFRFDPDADQPEESYWLEFVKDTDVMRSPVAQDQFKRLYWTDGDEIPKYAPATMVLTPAADGSFPGHGYDLGVPKPTTKPTVTGYVATEEVTKVTRAYVLTYFNATTAKESTPGKQFTVSTVDGVAVKLTNLPTDNKGDTGITHKRLYRKIPLAGTAPVTAADLFHKIGEIPLIDSEFTDEITDEIAKNLPLLPAGLALAPPSPLSYPAAAAEEAVVTTAVRRTYRYTIKNITFGGKPENQSAPSLPIDIVADDTQKITVGGLVNSNGGTDFLIYRQDVGWQNTLLIKQIPANQTSFVDDLALSVDPGNSTIGTYGPSGSAPPTPTVSASASTRGDIKQRTYMVTFVDTAGHESGKSPNSPVVEVADGVTPVSLIHSEPIPAGVTKKRLYRNDITVSSGNVTINDAMWRFVAENFASATQAYDKIATADLSGAFFPTALQGIPPSPTTTPTTTVTIKASEPPESRTYVYTYVTAYDEEGPPSEASEVVSVDPAGDVVLTIPGPPGGNYNITHKRIYRSATGSNRTKFQLVNTGVDGNPGDLAAATTTYTDKTKTSQLGELLPSDGWIPPPVGLKGLRLMANGAAVGFAGNSLYFSEPNLPHAWPHEYPIDEKIVGIGVFGQTVAVLTPGFPHLFQGVDPAAMSDTKLNLPQACVNKRGIVETGEGVMYPSPDGLVMIGVNTSLVTQALMSRDIWQSYFPESMECYVYNGRIIVTYFDGMQRGVLLFDISGSGAAFTTADINRDLPLNAGYYSPKSDTLYFGRVTDIVRFDDGPPLLATWKSKKFRLPQHDNFGFAQVICKAYTGSPTFKLWADGVLKYTKILLNREQFRLPAGFKSLDWEFQIEGTVEFTETFVATSSAELQSA